MSNDFINGLVATAQPVRPRRPSREALAVLTITLIEAVGIVQFYDFSLAAAAFAHSPFQMAMKVAVFGALALAALGLAVWSFDPAARRLGSVLAIPVTVTLLISLMAFDLGMTRDPGATLVPSSGVHCLVAVISLSLPVTLGLGLMMAKGASVQPGRSAFLTGLAGGAFGAFLFALQCPHLSFWYLLVWYGGAITLVSLLAVLILPRLARW